MEIIIISHLAAWETIAFKQIKGHVVTVSIQRSCPDSMQAFYLTAVNVKGPFLESDANGLGGEQ